MIAPGLGAVSILSLAAVCGWAMSRRRHAVVFLPGAAAFALLLILSH